MLANLDTLIGFAVVMLGIALIVTVVIQGISGLLNLRGMALAAGLEDLFRLAKVSEAAELARGILKHPLISDSGFRHWPLVKWPRLKRLTERWTLASAIRKSELVDLLQSPSEFQLSVAAPATAVATVEKWFDAQMDRVSQVFAQRARVLTIFMSVVLALALHLDTLRLFQKFSSNPELRAQVVATAGVVRARAESLQIGGAGADASPSSPETVQQQKTLKEVADELAGLKGTLTGMDLGLVPRFVPAAEVDLAADKHALGDVAWFMESDPQKRADARKHLLGILASAALLSLGAPFWFSLLKTLTNLRPILANKEHKEREDAAKDST